MRDMSFSEDPSSPAAPFSGDGSGQIFDLPDMVAGSPTTRERVVDTQSGFLVVIRKLNDRLALSIKRHVGTPPGSSVPLTPDESLKLSRILASSFSSTDDLSSETCERKERRTGEDRRRPGATSRSFGGVHADDETTISDLVAPAQSISSVPVPLKLMLASVLRTFMVPLLGIVLSVFALGIGAGITGLRMASKNKVRAPVLVGVPDTKDVLDAKKVDGFVRDFVVKMLDFKAKSYHASQVQAMAVMSPDLLERYWQETKFPLTKRQLSALPQGANILITELKRDRIDARNMIVDVRAQFSDAANPRISTPVVLRLKLALDANRQIVVIDQQDLSSTASK